MLTGTGAGGASHQLVVAGSASAIAGSSVDAEVAGAVERERRGVQHVGVVGRRRVEPAGQAQEVAAQRRLPAGRRVHPLDVGEQHADGSDRGGADLLGA